MANNHIDCKKCGIKFDPKFAQFKCSKCGLESK